MKRALLEAATKLLDADGIAAVTIRAVAREVGVSHAAPVNHYKNRSALLTAIAAVEFEAMRADIEKRLKRPDLSPADRIEVIPSAMLDYGLQHPNRYQLLWHREQVDYADPRILQVTDSIYYGLCNEIKAALPDANIDPDTVAISLWSMVHGYVDMRLNGMFLDKTDTATGLPRKRAMLDLLRVSLGLS